MTELPMADARQNDKSRKIIHATVAARNLAGAANNTKWNELISHFRQRPGWRPSYRSKSIKGPRSDWDVEWFYHPPFPFAYVEWFDIGLWELRPPWACYCHKHTLTIPKKYRQSSRELASSLKCKPMC